MTDDLLKMYFNDAEEERGVFEEALFQKFGERATAKLVVEKMKLLQIPLPDDPDQFIMGQEGLLVFSNPHGVIIRIEKEDGKGYDGAVRAPDSAHMLQPLGAMKAGKAVIEIVPGIHADDREGESRKLYWKMWSDGYLFWDERKDNIGRLPAVPELPGADTPVIIDRMAVQHLSGGTAAYHRATEVLKGEENRFSFRSPRTDPKPVLSDLRKEWDQAMKEVTRKTPDLTNANKYQQEGYDTFMRLWPGIWPEEKEEPDFVMPEQTRIALHRTMELVTESYKQQQVRSREELGEKAHQFILYNGLVQAFDDAWPKDAEAPDAVKMTAFWQQVVAAKQKGRLVDGWNEAAIDKTFAKIESVPKAAKAYEGFATRIGKPEAGRVVSYPKPSRERNMGK